MSLVKVFANGTMSHKANSKIWKSMSKLDNFNNPRVQIKPLLVPTFRLLVVLPKQRAKLQNILPSILNQLGSDSLRKLAEQFKQQGVGEGEGATPMTTIQEDYTLTFTYLGLQDYLL